MSKQDIIGYSKDNLKSLLLDTINDQISHKKNKVLGIHVAGNDSTGQGWATKITDVINTYSSSGNPFSIYTSSTNIKVSNRDHFEVCLSRTKDTGESKNTKLDSQRIFTNANIRRFYPLNVLVSKNHSVS